MIYKIGLLVNINYQLPAPSKGALPATHPYINDQAFYQILKDSHYHGS